MRTSRTIKYTLFAFCYIFWVASGLMIAVGIYSKTAVEGGAVDSLIADPALILIIVGCLIFCITFLGCFGALRDIQILLKIVEKKAVALLEKGIIRYRDDLDLQNLIDYIQKKFKCCGASSYKDWSQNMYFSCVETNPSLEQCGVPYSCCIMTAKEVLNTMCGYETQQLKFWMARKKIYTDGCLNTIVHWGHKNLLLIGGIALGQLLLEGIYKNHKEDGSQNRSQQNTTGHRPPCKIQTIYNHPLPSVGKPVLDSQDFGDLIDGHFAPANPLHQEENQSKEHHALGPTLKKNIQPHFVTTSEWKAAHFLLLH
ncbi:tetraspanin-33 isoform X2 [Hemitrygon akajei]|uniref:tetraspanin-33 isoform X2 n=1 Tax=Hemitrygon akajei TaxID=2704970 RepID=UPI003BFA223A